MRKEIILSTESYYIPQGESPMSLMIQFADGSIKPYGWSSMGKAQKEQFNFIKFIGKDESEKVIVIPEDIGWRATSQEGVDLLDTIIKGNGKCFVDWDNNKVVKVNSKVTLYLEV